MAKNNPNDYKIILSDVKNCTECSQHLAHGVRPVLQIHPEAKILIAGQAPGSKVHATGIPFDDPSGERLRAWMGIDKNIFYNEKLIAILPMGFCYPGTGKSGDLPPRKECAEKWRKKLLALMPNVELMLLIGQYAQAWHNETTKKQTVTQTVKDWQSFWPSQLPLPHPSPRNNIWLKKNQWFESDVIPSLQKRIKKILKK